MNTLVCSQARLSEAVEALRAGGVVAYPTEGVFALGCDPDCAPALRRIRQLKQRSPDSGFIVIGDHPSRFEPWVDADLLNDQKFTQPTEQPTTWVMPCLHQPLPLLVGEGQSTLAVRLIDYQPTRLLCQRFGKALVSTSANYADQRPTRTTDETLALFDGRLEAIVDTPVGGADGCSRIVDFVSLREIRSFG